MKAKCAIKRKSLYSKFLLIFHKKFIDPSVLFFGVTFYFKMDGIKCKKDFGKSMCGFSLEMIL